jgi:hypothetical protein
MRRAAISDRRRGAGRTFLFREVDDEVDLKAHRQRQGYSLSISTKKTKSQTGRSQAVLNDAGKPPSSLRKLGGHPVIEENPYAVMGIDAIQGVRLS